MQRALILGAVLAGLTAWWAPSTARACGPLPPGAYGIKGHAPADGAMHVARDEPLVFELDCESDDALAELVCAQGVSLQVQVASVDGGGALLSGATYPFAGRQVFRFEAPLAADTEYEVYARLPDDALQAADAVSEVSFRFTTGVGVLSDPAGPRDPITQIQLYDAPVAVCDDGTRLQGAEAQAALAADGPCAGMGPACAPDGSVEAQRLVIRFPALSGGVEQLGYDLRAVVTDETPGVFGFPGEQLEPGWEGAAHELALYSQLHVEAGEQAQLHIDLPAPDGGVGQTVCVRALAVDAAGQAFGTEPRCQPYAVWLSEPAAQRWTPPEDGCSLAGRASSARPWWMLVWLGLPWLRRRRAHGLRVSEARGPTPR